MQSIQTKERYQNSVKYAGVDRELEPALPQVGAGGPVTEELPPNPHTAPSSNQRTSTQRQLALVAHVTASIWQYITF